MRKVLSILILTIALLYAMPVIAQNKVVVIPMGGSSAAAANDKPWIKIYDANDTFVGYFVADSVTGTNPVFFAISSKGYLASFQTGKDYNGYDWSPSVEELIYMDSGCSGPMYIRGEEYGVFKGGRTGTAWLSSGALDFYIATDATPVVAPQYYSGNPCLPTFPAGGPHNYYQMVQNDPLVTGFQNDYTVPFKAVFELPATP